MCSEFESLLLIGQTRKEIPSCLCTWANRPSLTTSMKCLWRCLLTGSILSICYGAGYFADEIEHCPALRKRAREPEDVRDLRPDDIEFVMAMGDSATAAFGAGLFSRPWQTHSMMCEWRGSSFSIGADEGMPTLFNFVKHYNPDVWGGSEGKRLIPMCLSTIICHAYDGTHHPKTDRLNGAVSASRVTDLWIQTKFLDNQLDAYGLGARERWKMLTIFIGTYDSCSQVCLPGGGTSPIPKALRILKNTLEEIKRKFPKTIVNILSAPDISGLKEFMDSNPRCYPSHAAIQRSCPCSARMGEEGQQKMKEWIGKWNEGIEKIAREFNVRERKDADAKGRPMQCGVMVSPIFKEGEFPKSMPQDFASPFDCFHPSLKAHRSMAIGIW